MKRLKGAEINICVTMRIHLTNRFVFWALRLFYSELGNNIGMQHFSNHSAELLRFLSKNGIPYHVV